MAGGKGRPHLGLRAPFFFVCPAGGTAFLLCQRNSTPPSMASHRSRRGPPAVDAGRPHIEANWPLGPPPHGLPAVVRYRHVMNKLLLIPVSAALLAGCATSDPAVSESPRPAAMCTACGSVWVAAPAGSSKPGMFRLKKHRMCPTCSRMAENYLSTGKMEGTCPECGKSLQPCKVDVRMPGQQSSP